MTDEFRLREIAARAIDAALTYEATIRCLNCGFVGVIKVLKGEKVSNQKCPNCECRAGGDRGE